MPTKKSKNPTMTRRGRTYEILRNTNGTFKKFVQVSTVGAGTKAKAKKETKAPKQSRKEW